MFLDVAERLKLLQLLPQKEDYASIKTIRRVRETIAFSEEELKALKFQEQGGRVVWDATSPLAAEREFPIDSWTTDKIREVLSRLNAEHGLSEDTISLYDKFITDYK